MSSINIRFKHNGKEYKNVLLDSDQPPSIFKETISQQTGVPPERLKVIFKGLKVGDRKSVV